MSSYKIEESKRKRGDDEEAIAKKRKMGDDEEAKRSKNVSKKKIPFLNGLFFS